jgi:hypothetical protein
VSHTSAVSFVYAVSGGARSSHDSRGFGVTRGFGVSSFALHVFVWIRPGGVLTGCAVRRQRRPVRGWMSWSPFNNIDQWRSRATRSARGPESGGNKLWLCCWLFARARARALRASHATARVCAGSRLSKTAHSSCLLVFLSSCRKALAGMRHLHGVWSQRFNRRHGHGEPRGSGLA